MTKRTVGQRSKDRKRSKVAKQSDQAAHRSDSTQIESSEPAAINGAVESELMGSCVDERVVRNRTRKQTRAIRTVSEVATRSGTTQRPRPAREVMPAMEDETRSVSDANDADTSEIDNDDDLEQEVIPQEEVRRVTRQEPLARRQVIILPAGAEEFDEDYVTARDMNENRNLMRKTAQQQTRGFTKLPTIPPFGCFPPEEQYGKFRDWRKLLASALMFGYDWYEEERLMRRIKMARRWLGCCSESRATSRSL